MATRTSLRVLSQAVRAARPHVQEYSVRRARLAPSAVFQLSRNIHSSSCQLQEATATVTEALKESAAAEEPIAGPSTAVNEATEPPASNTTAAAHIDAWERAGVHPLVAARLVAAYPDAAAPTPAQRAFLLAAMRGDVDVYLKDYMGRGKTFSLALAALSLVAGGERQVIMIVPTPHLAQQVCNLLGTFAPQGVTYSLLGKDEDMQAPVIVATPGAVNTAQPHLPGLTHILLDEPDTMLGSLPPRHATPRRLAKHPVNIHPPPVADALNYLLGIETYPGSKGQQVDFTRRNNVRTLWASATLPAALRRFVYGRGWVKADSGGGGIVDLDFTISATPRQKEIQETVNSIASEANIPATEPVAAAAKPVHYAFAVTNTGSMVPLQQRTDGEEGRLLNLGEKSKVKMSKLVIEALAFLHATSPPPPGTYALVLGPAAAPLTTLAEEIALFSIAVAPLVPEALAGVIDAPESKTAPMFVSSRAAVTGLHLPGLHTVYLLNGLDMASLTPKQRANSGEKLREIFYSVVAGRLGRVGASAGHIHGAPQRVISLVAAGSEEENGLHDMFNGVLGEESHEPEFRLSEWKGQL